MLFTAIALNVLAVLVLASVAGLVAAKVANDGAAFLLAVPVGIWGLVLSFWGWVIFIVLHFVLRYW